MLNWIIANLIVILHIVFVCFVVLGGLLAFKWRWIVLVHIPAAIWGALIEYQDWLCPLTPLEQRLRQASGQSGYSGSFIDQYLVPVLYPEYLSRDLQIVLGTFVVAINIAIYSWLVLHVVRKTKSTP